MDFRGPIVGTRRIIERAPSTFDRDGTEFPGAIISVVETPLYALQAWADPDPEIRQLCPPEWRPAAPETVRFEAEEMADAIAELEFDTELEAHAADVEQVVLCGPHSHPGAEMDSAAARGIAALNIAARRFQGSELDPVRMAKVAAPFIRLPERALTPREQRLKDLRRRAGR